MSQSLPLNKWLPLAIAAAAVFGSAPRTHSQLADVVVGRSDGEGMRWAIYRFSEGDFAGAVDSHERAFTWGSSRRTTAIAAGDLDSDGFPEFVIGRNGGSDGNMRWQGFELADSLVVQLGPSQGNSWGDDRGVSALAVGDIDGNGRDEVIVGRSPGDGMRWAAFEFDGSTNDFVMKGSEQGDWGDERGVTALAVGNFDGDCNLDVAVGRNGDEPDGGMRWAVFRFDASAGASGDFVSLGSERGKSWGDKRSVSAIAAGDIDGDGRDELIVGRNAGANMRWAAFEFDDAGGDFVRLGPTRATGWGDERGVTALAVGNFDGDGNLDVAVGRNGDEPNGGMRWAAFRFDRSAGTDGDFVRIGSNQGGGWGDKRGVTSLAAADVDRDGRDEVIVGRSPGANMRWATFEFDDSKGDFVRIGSPQGRGRRECACRFGDTRHRRGRSERSLGNMWCKRRRRGGRPGPPCVGC